MNVIFVIEEDLLFLLLLIYFDNFKDQVWHFLSLISLPSPLDNHKIEIKNNFIQYKSI